MALVDAEGREVDAFGADGSAAVAVELRLPLGGGDGNGRNGNGSGSSYAVHERIERNPRGTFFQVTPFYTCCSSSPFFLLLAQGPLGRKPVDAAGSTSHYALSWPLAAAIWAVGVLAERAGGWADQSTAKLAALVAALLL